ncbi:hypothetical protein CC2G_015147 [Coprinopsis cinerea AmutBmut pab1-1]|nr:hypothetical protein CC2G_015147 [Coprinopsis cinerea AmutBmut pab1-1]
MLASFLNFSCSSPLAQMVNLRTLSITTERRVEDVSSFLDSVSGGIKLCEKKDTDLYSRPLSGYDPNIHYVFDLLPYDPQPLATISDEARQDQLRSLKSRISMASSRLKTLEARMASFPVSKAGLCNPNEKAAALRHRTYCDSYVLFAVNCDSEAEAFLLLQEDIIRVENAVTDLEIRVQELVSTRAWKERVGYVDIHLK